MLWIFRDFWRLIVLWTIWWWLVLLYNALSKRKDREEREDRMKWMEESKLAEEVKKMTKEEIEEVKNKDVDEDSWLTKLDNKLDKIDITSNNNNVKEDYRITREQRKILLKQTEMKVFARLSELLGKRNYSFDNEIKIETSYKKYFFDIFAKPSNSYNPEIFFDVKLKTGKSMFFDLNRRVESLISRATILTSGKNYRFHKPYFIQILVFDSTNKHKDRYHESLTNRKETLKTLEVNVGILVIDMHEIENLSLSDLWVKII